MTEKAYEKHAWVLLFAVGLVVFLFGLVTAIAVVPDPDLPAIAGIRYDALRSSNPEFADYIDFLRMNLGFFLWASRSLPWPSL